MYLAGWFRFLTLEKRPFVGDVLCIPAMHPPLVTQAVCPLGVHPMRAAWVPLLWQTVWVVW